MYCNIISVSVSVGFSLESVCEASWKTNRRGSNCTGRCPSSQSYNNAKEW